MDYLIASTERTGSNLLCDYLQKMEVGFPTEHCTRNLLESRLAEWKIIPDKYPKEVRDRFRVNGHFGLKAQWSTMRQIIQPLWGDVMVFFPIRPKVIYTFRSDLVAQAVSLSIAQQSGEWWSKDPAKVEHLVLYSDEELDRLIVQLQDDAHSWMSWAECHELSWLAVEYEKLIAQPVVEIRRVLDYLGVVGPKDIPEPELRSQHTERNDEWIRRYKE